MGRRRKSEAQQLVDLVFEVALMMQMGSVRFDSREKCAKWVARQLRLQGFPTQPCGMSWGVLVRDLSSSPPTSPTSR